MGDLSLDKAMGTTENFSLLNVLKAEQDEFVGCSTEPKIKIKQARRSIEIDQDVVDAMRKQFGNMPLGVGIRIMLGLKPKVAQNAWQEEEDTLIREHYPTNGGVLLAKVLGRSADCIRDRASDLGVKRVWLYKRDQRHKNAARREKARQKREQGLTK
ncbi:hypothetical protein LCGC14_2141440 [marine sediment metagenome]|uniref:Uncharacterized protein n=1 Tax=marine sediment metagenome TaxID=412755 RepID=A0A0F9DYA6_9ZZZZ